MYGFALHGTVLTCNCRCSDKLCKLTMVFWVFLSPHSNIPYTMMSVFNAEPPEGSKVTSIRCWFSALSLEYSKFFRFFERFDYIMDCRWWNHQIPCNWMLRNIVFKPLDDFLTELFTKWWTSPHLWLWTTGLVLLYPITILNCLKLTCLPVECSKQALFVHSWPFPVFCCPRPNFFGTCCRDQFTKDCIISKNNKVYQFEH